MLTIIKTWWQRVNCKHHWHWPLVDNSLTGEVKCSKCGMVDDLGAHWNDTIDDERI